MSHKVSISHRPSVVGKFSDADPMDADPVKYVTVAVLPPRLPPGMAPPTGLGPADAFSWDDAVSYSHNEVLTDQPRRKSFLNKVGLTTQQKKTHDTPPFVKRQVTYDVWRMHYAKDAEGNYQGTHVPAEDCLLKPDDVTRWRETPPKVRGDMYTRGDISLTLNDLNPYRRPSRAGSTASANSGLGATDHNESEKQPKRYSGATLEVPGQEQQQRSSSQVHHTIANGKTAAEIIAEAEAKPKLSTKEQWKAMLKNGTNFTLLGN